MASLLENFKKDGFAYTPSSVTKFSILVTGVPPVPSNLDQSVEQIDLGNAVMIEAIKDFKTEKLSWETERREMKRFWFDTLSPVAASGGFCAVFRR